MSNREDKIVLLIGLGIIGTVIIGALLFYGTIAAIAIHFIHKFW